MALTNFGFIVQGDGFNPESDVQVMETPSFKMTTIGVANAEQGGDAARRLVADGAQLIELCGGFGPICVTLSLSEGGIGPIWVKLALSEGV